MVEGWRVGCRELEGYGILGVVGEVSRTLPGKRSDLGQPPSPITTQQCGQKGVAEKVL